LIETNALPLSQATTPVSGDEWNMFAVRWQNCLQSFERFTGRKSCPMCRRESYQTRVVHEGVAHLREKMATVYARITDDVLVRSI